MRECARCRNHQVERLDAVDRSLGIVPGGEQIKRGHTNGPVKVALPDGYLDDRDDLVVPDDADVMALSGG